MDPEFKFPISCVIMAAGVSRRFQVPEDAAKGASINKLLVNLKGKPLLKWTLDSFARLECCSRIVVARDDRISALVSNDVFQLVWNKSADFSHSITIRKAILALPSNSLGCLFSVGDQPYLSYSSLYKLCKMFCDNPDKIVSLSWKNQLGNPTIFPRCLFEELLNLEKGLTGKSVVKRHPELLMTVEANNKQELMDIDTRKHYIDAQEDVSN